MLLYLTDGSGSFHLDYKPKDIARVDYITANRTLQVMYRILYELFLLQFR